MEMVRHDQNLDQDDGKQTFGNFQPLCLRGSSACPNLAGSANNVDKNVSYCTSGYVGHSVLNVEYHCARLHFASGRCGVSEEIL